MNEEELFIQALAITDTTARAAFLDRECRDHDNLRRQVEALLAAHAGSNVLDRPPREIGRTGPYQPANGVQIAEQPGTVIGPYRLMEQIGEGGMGLVFVAEQQQPVRRKVALKIIKPGMDTREVVARFEAERQALALMDHPNIARVFDGGTTESGRPFFVMELVKGIPIVAYCDEVHLPLRQRLALFVAVCQAVQHAHQKGVIHRDLKPSNILVAPHDGIPVVKVIDFGIAKAIGQQLTDKTIYTRFAQMIGTPLYMSPEQAEINALDVDVRSDIYSLGVLLYELLTGTTPFDKQRFATAAFDEIRRIIKEEEPPKPSTKLSSSANLPHLAASRQADPLKLTRQVRGELDWIVMKALEKDRTRRYETANGLGRDIERYLADEVVEARPPSTVYRWKKVIRRHRGPVLAAAIVFLALLAGIIGTTWGLLRTIEAEQQAREERDEGERAREQAERAREAETEARKSAETQAVRLRVEQALRELGLDKDLKDPQRRKGLLLLARLLPTIPEYLPEWRQHVALNLLAWGQTLYPLLPMPTHDGFAINKMALSPDGKLLLTHAEDQTVRLWEFPSLRQRALLQVPGMNPGSHDTQSPVADRFGFSPDGRTIWVVSGKGCQTLKPRRHLWLWDSGQGQLLGTIHEPGMQIGRVCFLPDSSGLLVDPEVVTETDGWRYGDCRLLYETRTGRRLAEFKADRITYRGEAISPDSRWIALPGFGEVRVFDAREGRLVTSLSRDRQQYEAVAFSPSGRRLAAHGDGHIDVWGVPSWQPEEPSFQVTRQRDFDKHFLMIMSNNLQFRSEEMLFLDGIGEPNLPGGTWLRGRSEKLGLTAYRVRNNLILTPAGKVHELPSLRLLRSPGRYFPAEAAQFAVHGRFLHLADLYQGTIGSKAQLVDLATELPLGPQDAYTRLTGSEVGWLLPAKFKFGSQHMPFPEWQCEWPWVLLPDRLGSIDMELTSLWARVAARGDIDEDGSIVPWDEATWERKRQELSQLPRPANAYPFPGHIAQDPLHWIREELEELADRVHTDRMQLELLNRLVAAEPTWLNYQRRAAVHRSMHEYGKALEDTLEVGRRTGFVHRSLWRYTSGDAWEAVSETDKPARQYELVLRWLDEWEKVRPESEPGLRGLALYRLGRFQEALAAAGVPPAMQVASVVQMLSSPWGVVSPGSRWHAHGTNPLILRAMCLHRLGQADQARTLLRSLRDQNSRVKDSSIRTWLMNEAVQLIDPVAVPATQEKP